jgi:histidinol-phosphate aminotransferase
VDVSPCNGDQMVENLAQRGVIVRSCRSFAGLPDHYIRVSVGKDWENELFIKAINGI